MATWTIEGRRIWIKTQYGEKCISALKSLGAHWDGDRKCWWISSAKQSAVEQIVNSSDSGKLTEDAETARLRRDQQNILGRVEYNGHSYYLVGHGSNDRGEWVRLLFRDGSKTFFKSLAEVQITKTYQKPQTLKDLQEYAERRKREAQTGICECWCHRSADCNCATGFCHFHHDGCDSCGCES